MKLNLGSTRRIVHNFYRIIINDKGQNVPILLTRLIVTYYVCKTGSITQENVEKLLIFEKMLRKIYRPMKNKSTEDYKRRKNTNLESLYNKTK